MDRLPPEILCHIHLLALPHPIHPYMYTEWRASVTAPLRISHICRAWRRLSLSFGELWSYLCINCFIYTTGSPVKIFDTWLERTNGMPLNFCISCDGWDGTEESHRQAEYIITTMLSQQHRWREVKLVWKDIQLSPEITGLKLTNMPMLESLILTAKLRIRANIDIGRSTRLRRLIVQETDFDLETGNQPLYSLTELGDILFGYVDRPGGEILCTWLNFLKVVPNLKEFRACSSRFRVDSPPPFRSLRHTEPFITLPNLHTLKLETFRNGHDTASHILDFVTLPSLQHLLFTSDTFESDLKGWMLVNFFRRSFPPLTSLVISWPYAKEDFVIQSLQLLPSLRHMRVRGAIVSRLFFNKLTVTTTNGTGDNVSWNVRGPFERRRSSTDTDFDFDTTICPHLETLFLERLRFEGDGDPCLAFITMLKSRAKVSRKFRDIHLMNGTDPLFATRRNLLIAEENISQFRRELRHNLVCQGVVVGNYESIHSLLVRRGEF